MKLNYEKITLRELVGNALIAAAKKCDSLYVIDSDLAKSTTTNKFQDAYPNRFIETGIAEQNAMSIAAGIASEGKIPFYANFAIFASGTCWTQLRQICYAKANVKIIATHPGMDGGFDGATHHANEDIALMRVLPNLKVLVPSNPEELKNAIDIAINCNGPVYIRCVRDSVPNVSPNSKAALGKAVVVEDDGNDFALIYEGSSTDLAFKSYAKGQEMGLKGKLINIFSIKPVDKELIRQLAKEVKKIVTVENHSVVGGLGSLIAETTCDMDCHAPIHMIGVEDTFTESGPSNLLKEKYGLSTEHVVSKLK